MNHYNFIIACLYKVLVHLYLHIINCIIYYINFYNISYYLIVVDVLGVRGVEYPWPTSGGEALPSSIPDKDIQKKLKILSCLYI